MIPPAMSPPASAAADGITRFMTRSAINPANGKLTRIMMGQSHIRRGSSPSPRSSSRPSARVPVIPSMPASGGSVAVKQEHRRHDGLLLEPRCRAAEKGAEDGFVRVTLARRRGNSPTEAKATVALIYLSPEENADDPVMPVADPGTVFWPSSRVPTGCSSNRSSSRSRTSTGSVCRRPALAKRADLCST